MKILFICTHNRCRSILAEAICNCYGDGLLEAVSAGSSPAEKVHPLTLHALEAISIPIDSLNSQSWDVLEDADIDYIITVCDKAANEPCPLWFGNAAQVHWGLEDPSAIEGDEEIINAAFSRTIELLKGRITQIKQWLRQDLVEEEMLARITALANDSYNYKSLN